MRKESQTFLRRYIGTGADGKGNVSNIVAEGREDFFDWSKYNRGRAIVFGVSSADEGKLCDALKAVDYQTESKNLEQMQDTLHNSKLKLVDPEQPDQEGTFAVSANGMVQREGSLLVVVNCKLRVSEYVKGQQEWMIDVGKAEIQIGSLLQKFDAVKCPTFAGKPKIFIFIDSLSGADQVPRTVSFFRSNALQH